MACCLAVLVASAVADAMQRSFFAARVVGVSDGDTITLLHEQRPVTVRLQGIDCPEGGQAFGTAAKRFTSDLVFGKEVTVMPRSTDRYGRMVADVTVDGRDLALALLEAGLAWHFTRYSDDPRLAAAERAARAARRGLWEDPSPVPPWEYRHPPPLKPGESVILHGNVQSRVYHGPRCQHYRCKNCTAAFATADAAAAAGYRPHGDCTKQESSNAR